MGQRDPTGHGRGRAGRHTVVHDHYGAVLQRHPRYSFPHQPFPPRQFRPLRGFHGLDLIAADSGSTDHIVVEHPDAALTDGPHRQFRLPRHAQLADQQDIQISADDLPYRCRGGPPTPPPPPPAYARAWTEAHIEWCLDRYRSYNPATNTFTGYDGYQHECRGPY